MPGMIMRVAVQVGDTVQPGQGLIVMEAMKMENELRATTAGTVKAVLARPGTAVEKVLCCWSSSDVEFDPI